MYMVKSGTDYGMQTFDSICCDKRLCGIRVPIDSRGFMGDVADTFLRSRNVCDVRQPAKCDEGLCPQSRVVAHLTTVLSV